MKLKQLLTVVILALGGGLAGFFAGEVAADFAFPQRHSKDDPQVTHKTRADAVVLAFAVLGAASALTIGQVIRSRRSG